MVDKFSIACEQKDVRLDVFLSEKLGLTRTKAKEMINAGLVFVDGRPPKPSMRLKEGARIDGEVRSEPPAELVAEEIPLDVIYKDEYFLAINKPAGMVVHPSFGHSSGTLVNAMLGYMEKEGLGSGTKDVRGGGNGEEGQMERLRPGIVHRLDKGTTGVILVARDIRTQEKLSVLFKDRNVHKIYRAIVEGSPRQESWVFEGNIGRHPVERKKMAVLRSAGREACTGFKVLERLENFAYIEAYPRTGRTHQIRVHLSHAGHPVAGDETYGSKTKKVALRPFLHAYRIEFPHPVTGVTIIIEAPIPHDMVEFLEKHRGQ